MVLFNQSPTLDTLMDTIKRNSVYLIRDKEHQKYFHRIIEAIRETDRRFFLDKPGFEYLDTALPIEHGQTISQPSTVVYMLLKHPIESGMTVLEIGSGSGWNAALLSYLVDPGQVYSFEVIPDLTHKAKNNVENLMKHSQQRHRYENIEFITGNIFSEDFDNLPFFDRIIITAGIEEDKLEILKEFAFNRLTENGKLICPQREGPMYFIKKKDNELIITKSKDLFRFVPLIL